MKAGNSVTKMKTEKQSASLNSNPKAEAIIKSDLPTQDPLFQENIAPIEMAMNAASMAWWQVNLSTGHVIFGQRKAEMLGYPPEKFNHYRDFMALVHPDDYGRTMMAMQKHLRELMPT